MNNLIVDILAFEFRIGSIRVVSHVVVEVGHLIQSYHLSAGGHLDYREEDCQIVERLVKCAIPMLQI